MSNSVTNRASFLADGYLHQLLPIVGSWWGTLDDAGVLALLRDWKAGGPTLHRGQ
jgi:hypothetical protein